MWAAGAIVLLGGGCGGDDVAVTPATDRSSSEPGESGNAPSEPNAAAPVTAATLGSPLTLAGETEGVEVEVTPLEVVDPAPHDGVFPPEGHYVSIQLRLGTSEPSPTSSAACRRSSWTRPVNGSHPASSSLTRARP